MRNAISKGDKVVTIGGIHGTVSSVKERTVIIKVEDGARIEFDRSAIASVISDKKASVKSDKDKKEEKIEQAKAEEKSEEKIEEKSEPASESTTEENASSAESAPAEKTE